MVGPPGSGKTLLARALPAILPRMSIDESLDVTRIYSVADQMPPGLLPFVPYKMAPNPCSYPFRVLRNRAFSPHALWAQGPRQDATQSLRKILRVAPFRMVSNQDDLLIGLAPRARKISGFNLSCLCSTSWSYAPLPAPLHP
jgi:hypothetical protein